MTRVIEGLRWARRCERPPAIPSTRLKGVKGAGIRFEKAFGLALPGAIRGQWFEFEDRNGFGVCQTDYLFRDLDRVIVVECKLSLTDEAFFQLQCLYLPVVGEAFRLKTLNARARGLIVTRNLREVRNSYKVFPTLRSAVEGDDISVLHWIGGPILLRTDGTDGTDGREI